MKIEPGKMRPGILLEIIERALQLNDEKLTSLLLEAKLIKPFSFDVSFDENMKPDKAEIRHPETGEVIGTIKNIGEE